jgi:XTP/dITP diphosphohydrolase
MLRLDPHTIVLATGNKKKLAELKRLLKGQAIRILGLNSFQGLPKVKEDKDTFKANARKKAIEISKRIDRLVMADDSGLEVPALGNAPGIYSARYAGISQDDSKNIRKLLKEMKHFKGSKRRARFRCAICLSKGSKVIKMVEGRVEGCIALGKKGVGGFGYDPVFVPEGFNKTFAQLKPATKDRISHRGLALIEARQAILGYFQRYH